jgi:hypothetical protein
MTHRKEIPTMTIADALAALVAELEAGDVPDPLRQDFSLACLWADLARIAGDPVPAPVAAILDGPACYRVPADLARRWLPTDAA